MYINPKEILMSPIYIRIGDFGSTNIDRVSFSKLRYDVIAIAISHHQSS